MRILNIYPGRVNTPMQERLCRDAGMTHYPAGEFVQPEAVAELVVHGLSLPRTAEMSELTINHTCNI